MSNYPEKFSGFDRGDDNVAERTIEVLNKFGLHARPSMMLVQTTGRFKSEIVISRDDMEVNGKSIMGVMMLAAGKGSKLTFRAEGPDAEEALDAVGKLFEDKFSEE